MNWQIVRKDGNNQKQMIDAMRERNGNLEIALMKAEVISDEL